MIKGESKLEPKIVSMLNSEDEELKSLGMQTLKQKQPAIYAALLNYVGYDVLDEASIKELYKNKEFNIGTQVKYRGMDQCPVMVITNVNMQNASGQRLNSKYFFHITAKYYNKSTQIFVTVQDRIECFEIIN